MASSALSICSNALQLLGDKAIASFTEDTHRASLAANLWPQTRDALLREHPWPCIRKQTILAPESTTPDFDWPYQFKLPGDWLRTIQVGRRGERLRFEVMGTRIYAEVAVLPLVYCWRSEDPSQWDSQLSDLASAAMVAAMAYPVTQSSSLAQLKLQIYNRKLEIAKSIAGQDNEPEDWADSPFLDVRF